METKIQTLFQNSKYLCNPFTNLFHLMPNVTIMHYKRHNYYNRTKHSGKGHGHINEVKLHQAWLVLGLVTTFGGSTVPVFSRPLKPTQPGHPSVGRCNEYWQQFRPQLGKKRRVLRSSRPCDQDWWHTGWSRSRALAVNLSQQSSRCHL